MTVKIDIPDRQATTLQAKAAAAGLTLEGWFRRMAEQEAPTGQTKDRYSLADLVRQCDLEAPLSDEDRAWIDAPATGRETF